MAEGQITKETLDLIVALRPFTGQRGRKLIDTIVEISQMAGSEFGTMEISSLTTKARDLLTERLDSAVSLALILAAAWLGNTFDSMRYEAPPR